MDEMTEDEFRKALAPLDLNDPVSAHIAMNRTMAEYLRKNCCGAEYDRICAMLEAATASASTGEYDDATLFMLEALDAINSLPKRPSA
jgi:hypothetical protein